MGNKNNKNAKAKPKNNAGTETKNLKVSEKEQKSVEPVKTAEETVKQEPVAVSEPEEPVKNNSVVLSYVAMLLGIVGGFLVLFGWLNTLLLNSFSPLFIIGLILGIAAIALSFFVMYKKEETVPALVGFVAGILDVFILITYGCVSGMDVNVLAALISVLVFVGIFVFGIVEALSSK